MYVGAQAVIRAQSSLEAREEMKRQMLRSGCRVEDCRPMTCTPIEDDYFDDDGVLAGSFSNGDY